MSLTEDLFAFIKECPTAFHTVAAVKRRLTEHGFKELSERDHWELSAGNGYITTRNDSSLIAFWIPDYQHSFFHIAAAHSDFPAFKVKESPELDVSGKYTKLNVEKYGGMLCAPWFDRPLSVAGRLVYDLSCLPDGMDLQKENSRDAFWQSTESDENDGEAQGDMFQRRKRPDSLLGMKLVNIDRDLVMIPNLAIHMNRQANDGYSYNAQKDMLPLFAEGVKKGRLKELAAEDAGIPADAILASDLFLYNRMEGTQWGEDNEFISAPRLDDLQCAYALLCGFLKGKDNIRKVSGNLEETIGAAFRTKCEFSWLRRPVRTAESRPDVSFPWDSHISVYALFDNEEVGSVTKQGADSTFLSDILYRIAVGLGKTEEEYLRMLASSFMISADNAHALHPNFPDKADPSNQPVLNGGIVIKYNANQKYTTDAVSSGYFQMLCRRVNVPYQTFFNRSDMAGGSTLGNISNKKVSIHTVDIGLPQLAMHSPYETAGSRDMEYLIRVMEEFYSCF